jgi:hypothetical protein
MRSGSAIDYGKTSDQLRISSRSLPNPDLLLFVQYRNLFFISTFCKKSSVVNPDLDPHGSAGH